MWKQNKEQEDAVCAVAEGGRDASSNGACGKGSKEVEQGSILRLWEKEDVHIYGLIYPYCGNIRTIGS